MLCERCKVREATIQYTEVVNGVRTEHNFCAQCASELDFGQYSTIFDSDFPLGKLLSGLLGVGSSNEEEKMNQVVCPTCKTSYGEFVKNSCFGCPDCYGVFDLLISEKIKQLQGSDTHKGKKPKYFPQMRYGRIKPQEAGKPVKEGKEAAETAELSELSGTARTAEADQAPSDKILLPEGLSRKEQIAILDKKRKDAVEREDYDSAARFRDQIRALRAEEDMDA